MLPYLGFFLFLLTFKNGIRSYYSDYKTHPPNLGGRGVSYSPNIAYLASRAGGAGGGGAVSQEAGAGPHFLLQNFFPIFLL